MKILLFVVVFLIACVQPAPAPTQPRDRVAQDVNDVLLEAGCDSGVSPSTSKRGHGVVVTSRHIVTALHVVACSDIAAVRAQVGGSIHRVYVTAEDVESDLALIEVGHAGDIAAPTRPAVERPRLGQRLCDRNRCGIVTSVYTDWVDYEGMAKPGESGSGVYNERGQLVGIVHGLPACSTGHCGTTRAALLDGHRFALGRR